MSTHEHSDLILHIDVDAFFPSVEQLLIPALRGRPVVVGSGVIASCSYEARAMGLHAGMPLHRARRLCPRAVFLAGSEPIYRCFAEAVWAVCRRYTCGLETYLDEAYGDATGMEGIHGGPLELGRKLQQEVRREVGLPVSVGLASNRMLAKLASASAKPGGVAHVPAGQEETFLTELPIEKLLGVGGKTAERFRDMNIRTVGQVRALSRAMLRSMFGANGEAFHDRCRGRDERGNPGTGWHPQAQRSEACGCIPGDGIVNHSALPPRTSKRRLSVPPVTEALSTARESVCCPRIRRIPHTISRETTFHQPTCRMEEIRGMLFYLLERAMRAARAAGLAAGCVELSIRYDDWKGDSARRSLEEPTAVDEEVFRAVLELLARLHRRRVALRHVGIVLSRFSPREGSGQLFEPPGRARRRGLHAAVDEIRDRWGHAAVVTGESAELLGQLEQNDYGFVLRTPSLTK